MAIDPKELENVRPTSSAVDKLKARKNRIKPWQTPTAEGSARQNAPDLQAAATPTSEEVASDLRHTPGLNAPSASETAARDTLKPDILISESDGIRASVENTDKIPTTKSASFVDTQTQASDKYRQNTDKAFTDNKSNEVSAAPSPVIAEHASTDKMPTMTFSDFEIQVDSNGSSAENTDKIPTTESAPTGVLKTSQTTKEINPPLESTDKVPTKRNYVGRPSLRSSTDKEPAKYRQRLNSADKAIDQGSSTDKIPAKNQQSADKIPTIVPTTDFAFVGTNTDNENALTPAVIEHRFKDLSGGQLSFLMYCYRECVARGSNSFATTYPDLAKAASIKESSIRTTAKIVKGRGLVEITFKKGPGGRIELLIPEMVFRVITRNQANYAWSTDKIPTTTEAENRQNTDHSTDKIASSKLVSDLNSSNSLTTPNYDGFDSIELMPVQHFGISRKHLQDIKNQKLNVTRFQLEDFIARFGQYASKTENVRMVKNIPALFIRMVQHLANGEDPLLDIATPEEALLKQLLERQKLKREATAKLQRELAEGEFEIWLSELSVEDRDKLAPPNPAARSGSVQQRMLLKALFLENIWPTRLIDLTKPI